jgi:DNA repair protein RadC
MNSIGLQSIGFIFDSTSFGTYSSMKCPAPCFPGRLCAYEPKEEDAIITRALQILECRLHSGDMLNQPASVKAFLRLQSGNLAHEVFGVIFLDNANRLIAYEPMFRGTLTHTAVHPREIVKRALALDAASVVLHHNHPSGCCQPSEADIAVTAEVGAALSMVEVTLLDHIITSNADALSMLDEGMLKKTVESATLELELG